MEVPSKMLPEEENTSGPTPEDVRPDAKPPVEEPVPGEPGKEPQPEPVVEPPVETLPETPDGKPPKGFVPSQALNEEREKRKDAQIEIDRLQKENDTLKGTPPKSEEDQIVVEEPPVEDPPVEEGSAESRLIWLEDLRKVEKVYPVIGEHEDDFKSFRQVRPGIDVLEAAKLFLLDKGIPTTEVPPDRKGLEKPTAGGDPPKSGYTQAQVKDLRINNHRKYEALIKAGKIKPEEISDD